MTWDGPSIIINIYNSRWFKYQSNASTDAICCSQCKIPAEYDDALLDISEVKDGAGAFQSRNLLSFCIYIYICTGTVLYAYTYITCYIMCRAGTTLWYPVPTFFRHVGKVWKPNPATKSRVMWWAVPKASTKMWNSLGRLASAKCPKRPAIFGW